MGVTFKCARLPEGGYVKEYRPAQSGTGRKLGCLFLVNHQHEVGSVAVVQH